MAYSALKSSNTPIVGSDEYYDIVCLPCNRNGKIKPASGYCIDCDDHLCYTCYSCHKTSKASCQHTLLDDKTMPPTQRFPVNEKPASDQPSEEVLPSNQSVEVQSNSKPKIVVGVQSNADPKVGVEVQSKSKVDVARGSAFKDLKATLHDKIFVKTTEDLMKCCITSMIALYSTKLLLADRNNNCLKLVTVYSKTVVATLTLGTEEQDSPWDMTTVTAKEAAVTVPGRQLIQFISIFDKLAISRTVKTYGYCFGICCHKYQLIVTFWRPAKLEFLDMDGNVMKSISSDSTERTNFSFPEYVRANNMFIYVSNSHLRQVIKMSWECEVTERSKDASYYRGLVVLNDESLLSSDYIRDCVYHTSEDCQTRVVMLEDVIYPWAICVNAQQTKLYVSRHGHDCDDTIDNNILVYNMDNLV